jgi:hypothetical protein
MEGLTLIVISCAIDRVKQVSFTGEGVHLAIEAETYRTIAELVDKIDGRLRQLHAKVQSALEADEAKRNGFKAG